MHSDSATSINADTTLLGRYASSRDAQAFAELVKRYSGLVFSTARRITGNDHDAEDVAQQCFLELARHAGKFSGPVVGWLYRVACTRSLNARRDRATRNTYEAKVDPRRSETPAESEWAELEPLIDQAIASLPDDQHLALILHYFQQKSQAQIASDCGVDQSTISRRLTQAIESLRSTLKKAGVVVTAAALPTLMLAHPTQAAPPALAVALTKVGLAGIGKTRPAFPVPYAAVAGVLAVTLAAVAILRTAQRDSTPPTSAPLFASTAPASPLQQRAITLQDTAGHPMSHVLVGTAAGQIYNGLQTDINGKLPASKFARGGQQYLAYSQRSAKMAIFSAPTGTQNALTPIMLNMNAANADGNVVNSSGAPIAGVTVKIFATLSDGHDFLLTTSGNTDNSGYYSVGPIPSAAGLKIRASLSDDPADPDGTPAIDTAGLLQIEIPDLVDPSGLAPARNPGPARARYSGRILDESGRPIQGVIVSMSYPYQHMIGEAGDAVTDGQGRFSRLLPPGAQDVSFRLLHPDYMGFHFAPDVSVDTSALRDGSAVIVMKKGWPVSGVVRDAFGNPVFNALVLAGRLYSSTAGPGAETIEDCTTNRTDLQGRFRIGGLPEGKNRLVITADQFAPQIIPMNLSANAPALQVTLDTGGVFSGEVVDSAGYPLAGASVGCEEWNVGESRGEAPLRLAKTDPNGRFTLEHLPRQGELSFLATHKGFLGTMFKWSNPRGPLQTVTLYKPPVVTGYVRDADTDAPVMRFDVVPGIYWNVGSDFDALPFDGIDHVKAADGRFSKRIQNIDTSSDLLGVAVRIVADGYLPQISPRVTLGKDYEPLVIHLKKAAAITGKVLLPDGQVADGASVYLVAPKEMAFVHGLAIDEGPTNSPQIQTKTDSAGGFKLPAAESPSRLLILHSFGYAITDTTAIKNSGSITLTPWARVQGVLRVSGKPVNGVALELDESGPRNPSSGMIFFNLAATTRVDGSFEFDQVPAMSFDLVPTLGRDAPIITPRLVQTTPGKVTQIDLSGDNNAASSKP